MLNIWYLESKQYFYRPETAQKIRKEASQKHHCQLNENQNPKNSSSTHQISSQTNHSK